MAANWMAFERTLQPAALTVRAQALPPDDMGTLLWNQFFPRQNVDSVDLFDVSTVDYRPTADRREWNARGRRVPMVTPTIRPVSIVPIESNDKIDEYEMQRIRERAFGNEDVINRIIGNSIPARVDRLARSNLRRIEVDAFTAWCLGTITQRNPENAAQTYAASFGFSGTRYVTAGTAWNAVTNAYATYLAAVTSAELLIGPTQGSMMRRATFNEILADAPNLPNSVTMTRSLINERISQDLGRAHTILINENTVHVFDDGGTAYTSTAVFPAQRVAFIPAGGVVGRTAFAPVVRAMELASQVGPAAGIDVNGSVVYYEESNGGRELSIECQVNALPIPDESKVYVVNAGV